MSLSEAERRELDEMLTSVCEGRLEDSQIEHLLRWLDQPEVQDCFVSHAVLDADLRMLHKGPLNLVLPQETSPPASGSPALGFLADLTHPGGSFTPTLWTLLVLVSGVVLTLALVIALVVRGIRVHVDGPEMAGSGPGAGTRQSEAERRASPSAAASQGGAPAALRVGGPADFAQPASSSLPRREGRADDSRVARLTRVTDCRWGDVRNPPRRGDVLGTGRELRIASGAIELDFDVGVRAVVRGPARLDLLTPTKVFLYAGKMTAEILKPEACGFEVRTARGSIADLGSELGVEVTATQQVRVHVFMGTVVVREFTGEVVVEEPLDADAAIPAQRLPASRGLRLEDEMSVLIARMGEALGRKIKSAHRDRHVIAYWRFADGPIGSLPPDTGRDSGRGRAGVDRSSQPEFPGDVPVAKAPAGGRPDRSLDLQKISPPKWTVEASVKPTSFKHMTQVLVERGGSGPSVAEQLPSRLTFSITRVKKVPRFVVSFYDVDGRRRKAVADKLQLQRNHWYHAAATSDGRVLRLYVDAEDGQGYRLQAAKELAATGNTALAVGSEAAACSIGWGKNGDGRPAAWFEGLIDEVRASDVARQPGEFLSAPKSAARKAKTEARREMKDEGPETQDPRPKT
jgi:hypothetical protein